MMECPFCLGQIDLAAVACRHCQRDLSSQAYLLRKLAGMTDAIARLEAAAAQNAEVNAAAVEVPSRSPAGRTAHPLDGAILLWAAAAVLALGFAHHLCVFTLNLGPLWFFLVALISPAPLGFAAFARERHGAATWAFIFAPVAVASIAAMHVDTTLTTAASLASASTPLLPETRIQLWQDVEFAGSIFFSLMAGVLLCFSILSIRDDQGAQVVATQHEMASLAKYLSLANSAESLERAGKYISAIGSVLSALIAVYLALKKL